VVARATVATLSTAAFRDVCVRGASGGSGGGVGIFSGLEHVGCGGGRPRW
jgi:hypothetical protein